ncbi:MAG: glycosyltransferase [Candidatus Bathyarchaeia archaeon]
MLSCSELGLGHVSRLMVLGRRLEERGNELFFFSGGNAYKLLKEKFRNVHHCTPVSWYENARGIVVSASVLNILFPLPWVNPETGRFGFKLSSGIETIHRYYDLRRNILKIKPDIIVSDGDLHALRLACRWRFPSVYITNVIRPSCGFPSLLIPGERFTERYLKNCLKIIVPDIPPPYTICEYNLGNLKDVGVADKVEFVGSFIDFASSVKGGEDHIFASISGPVGTRFRLRQIIIPVLSRLKTRSMVSLGEQGEKRVAKIGNCMVYTWLSPEERGKCMANAKVVIFSGGHSTCFEVVKYVKPSICIPTQPEQLANAKKMQAMQCSVIVHSKEQLTQAIREIEGNIDFYKKNVRRLNIYANKFKGVDRAVEIIENAA